MLKALVALIPSVGLVLLLACGCSSGNFRSGGN